MITNLKRTFSPAGQSNHISQADSFSYSPQRIFCASLFKPTTSVLSAKDIPTFKMITEVISKVVSIYFLTKT